MQRGIQFTAVSSVALLVSLFVFGIGTGSAQSLGDLARQQRERMNARASNTAHVYTNEDLARPKILDLDNQEGPGAAALEVDSRAAKMLSPISAAAPIGAVSSSPRVPPATALTTGYAATPAAVPACPAGTPLGDVARFYRQQRTLHGASRELPVAAKAPQETKGDRPESTNSKALAPRTDRFTALQPSPGSQRMVATTRPAAPAMALAAQVVRVNPGDSLWKIASRYLGNGNRWREIASANPEIRNPDQIPAGLEIHLPGEAATPATKPSRIGTGDSRWKLARL